MLLLFILVNEKLKEILAYVVYCFCIILAIDVDYFRK